MCVLLHEVRVLLCLVFDQFLECFNVFSHSPLPFIIIALLLLLSLFLLLLLVITVIIISTELLALCYIDYSRYSSVRGDFTDLPF